jgi:16S rRNA (guanine527-N7)-methyltransferase
MPNTPNFKLLLQRLNPQFTTKQLEQLAAFLVLLVKWNKAFNLTAITEPLEMVTHHILDSLSISPYLHGGRIIDIGTGAGLPGIPLAIMHPEKQFVLLDSNQKKTRFCQQAVMELSLKNVEVVHSRVEKLSPTAQFDTILSRAFASINDMLSASKHLRADKGIFLAMKGRISEEELAGVSKEYAHKVHELIVPGLNAQRCVVIIY